MINMGDMIEWEHCSLKLTIISWTISNKVVNVEAPIRIHHKSWTKYGGMDIKELDQITFEFILNILLNEKWCLKRLYVALKTLLCWFRNSIQLRVHLISCLTLLLFGFSYIIFLWFKEWMQFLGGLLALLVLFWR